MGGLGGAGDPEIDLFGECECKGRECGFELAAARRGGESVRVGRRRGEVCLPPPFVLGLAAPWPLEPFEKGPLAGIRRAGNTGAGAPMPIPMPAIVPVMVSTPDEGVG